MKKQFIKDLKAGDSVRTFFVAKRKRLEYFRDKTKGRFLTVVLADRSGHLLARAWTDADALADRFEEEDIIAVKGRVDEYLGRRQIIIEKLRPPQPKEKDTLYSEDDFVPQSEKDAGEQWNVLSNAVEQMANVHLKSLLQAILSAEAEGLRAAPASKAQHHAYRGGLLEHIVEMLTLARCLCTLYTDLDGDVLAAGVIVHDLGLVQGARYARDIDYSDAGRLQGHVVLGDRMVAAYIAQTPDFPPDLALRLSHMILSHHGELEHGAARPPQTLEAVALHMLNRLSAEVNHVVQFLDAQWDASRSWTEFDHLRDRFYFRGHSQEPEPAPDGPAGPAPAADAADEPPDDGAPSIAEQRPAYAGVDPPSSPSPESPAPDATKPRLS